jgi:hypothetical protein
VKAYLFFGDEQINYIISKTIVMKNHVHRVMGNINIQKIHVIVVLYKTHLTPKGLDSHMWDLVILGTLM